MSQINRLTPKQETLIPVYLKKWDRLAFSTEPIDIQKARKTIEDAYNKPFEQILVFDSPYALCKEMEPKLREKEIGVWGMSFLSPLTLKHGLGEQLQFCRGSSELATQLWKYGWGYTESIWQPNLLSEVLIEQLKRKRLFRRLTDCMEWCMMSREALAFEAAFLDFFQSELGFHYPEATWFLLEQWVKNCGLLYTHIELDGEEIAMMSDRPRILRLDDRNRPHAECEPAIEFVDGYQIYAYHGVILPKKYRNIPSNQWRSQWLLSERNLQLRRALIQGIGRDRLRQELSSEEFALALRKTPEQ